jgi:hypothetical protein
MSISKPVILLSVMISTLLLLGACGGDADTASVPAPAAESASATSGDSMGSSMDMEKAEGVIYQDEIYANWPYN